jgi:hypothetical protein
MALAPFRRKFGKILLIVVLTVLLGWGLWHLGRWMFTIRSIEVVGENIEVRIDESKISKNLLFFPAESLRTQVLSDNQWLKDVRFEKRFPRTLRIVPILRDPMVIVQSSDRVVLVDRDGIVLTEGDQGLLLPRIVFSGLHMRIGQKLTDERVQLVLTFIDATKEDVTFRRIVYEENAYFRAIAEKVNILIAQDKSVSETVSTLQMLFAGFRIKGTLPSVVDLRFDKPVVTF